MSISPWPALLSEALSLNTDHRDRYVQLASLSDSGEATCRTLVMRRWLPDETMLVATTDLRSHKVRGLRHHPQGEICWWLPTRNEQFRFRGTVILQGAEPGSSLREEIWDDLAPAGKLNFTGPAPGTALTTAPVPRLATPPATPPDNFVLLMMRPLRVDYLRLDNMPHQRWLYEYHRGDGSHRSWHARAIAP